MILQASVLETALKPAPHEQGHVDGVVLPSRDAFAADVDYRITKPAHHPGPKSGRDPFALGLS